MQKYSWSQPRDVEQIVEVLCDKHCVVGDSDTVPGLFATVTEQGFALLNRLKNRYDKPYLIVVADVDAAKLFVADPIPDYAQELMARYWPGPLTLIMRARDGVPTYCCSAQGTVAVRVPEHAGIRAVAKELGGLFSTSANYSGHPVPDSIEEVDADLVSSVGALIRDEHKKVDDKQLPSTIIDCTGQAPRIIRRGALADNL